MTNNQTVVAEMESMAFNLQALMEKYPGQTSPAVVCSLQAALGALPAVYIEECLAPQTTKALDVTDEFMHHIDSARRIVADSGDQIEYQGWHCFAIQVGDIFATMTADRPNSDIEAEEHCTTFIERTTGEAFGHLLMQTVGPASDVAGYRLTKDQRLFWADVAETIGPDHTKSLRHAAAFADKMLSF